MLFCHTFKFGGFWDWYVNSILHCAIAWIFMLLSSQYYAGVMRWRKVDGMNSSKRNCGRPSWEDRPTITNQVANTTIPRQQSSAEAAPLHDQKTTKVLNSVRHVESIKKLWCQPSRFPCYFILLTGQISLMNKVETVSFLVTLLAKSVCENHSAWKASYCKYDLDYDEFKSCSICCKVF